MDKYLWIVTTQGTHQFPSDSRTFVGDDGILYVTKYPNSAVAKTICFSLANIMYFFVADTYSLASMT